MKEKVSCRENLDKNSKFPLLHYRICYPWNIFHLNQLYGFHHCSKNKCSSAGTCYWQIDLWEVGEWRSGTFQRTFQFFPISDYMHTFWFWKIYQNFSQAGSCLHFGEHLSNLMGYKQDKKVEPHTIRRNGYVCMGDTQVKQQRVAWFGIFFYLFFFCLIWIEENQCHWRDICRVKNRTVRFACQDHWSRERSCINPDEGSDGHNQRHAKGNGEKRSDSRC